MAWKMNPIYFEPYIITKCRIRTKQVYKFYFALYILYYILTSVWRRHFVSAVYVRFINVTLLYHRVWLTFCRLRFKLADISQYFVFDAWDKKSPNYKIYVISLTSLHLHFETWIISHKIIVLFHLPFKYEHPKNCLRTKS